MLLKRNWVTPLVIGAFLLAAVTGITLFFEVNTLLGKNAHMYLGLVFVLGGLFHIAVNFPAFKQHLKQTRARIIIGLYALILVATFVPVGPKLDGGGEMGLRGFMDASLTAPIKDVAAIIDRDPEAVMQQLRDAGYDITDPSQSIMSAVKAEGEEKQLMGLNAINVIMKVPAGTRTEEEKTGE